MRLERNRNTFGLDELAWREDENHLILESRCGACSWLCGMALALLSRRPLHPTCASTARRGVSRNVWTAVDDSNTLPCLVCVKASSSDEAAHADGHLWHVSHRRARRCAGERYTHALLGGDRSRPGGDRASSGATDRVERSNRVEDMLCCARAPITSLRRYFASSRRAFRSASPRSRLASTRRAIIASSRRMSSTGMHEAV